MGQMAPEVIGLSLFLLLAFCAPVTVVGKGLEGPKAECTGHSPPSFTPSINK